MKLRANRIFVYALLLTLPFLLSGCFLRLLFGSVGQRDPDFDIAYIARIGGIFGPMATCNLTPDEEGVDQLGECTYSFFDFELENPFVVSSTTELRETFGVFGVFIDPLIVQVPVDSSNFTATIHNTITRTVVISEVTSFKIEPGKRITAEAGHKFVILDFPPDLVADMQAGTTLTGPFDFDLEFQVAALEPLEVKAMYTGKIELNGQTYYPPLLPCVESFAEVPTVTIPQAATNFLLQQQIIGAVRRGEIEGCAGKVYDFSDAEVLPTKLFMPSVSAHEEEGMRRR